MSEKDVEIVFVGDAYVQRPNPDSAFEHVGPYLRAADIAFCNLETVVADTQYLVQEHAVRALAPMSGCCRLMFGPALQDRQPSQQSERTRVWKGCCYYRAAR